MFDLKIEKNLGNIERITRLLFGTGLFAWLTMQPVLGLVDVFAGLIAISLILNGIFSRCYLWYILDIDSSPRCDDQLA